ncbi:MAG TPA: hypothetical protein VGM60_18005 [Pseudonocardia sp.]|jgi:hypothetical protein|uniref:hypothetical protein n=1 Tax=Pseudonocardia sp. TaxID=60912 RepID=UPI002F3E7493
MTNTASGLKLEPDMIPKLRRAFENAIQQLQPALGQAQSAQLAAPAMKDQASVDFQTAFNKSAVQGPDSAAESLKAFHQRLQGVVQQLGAIQQAYNNHDTELAQNLSSQLEH